MSDDDYSQVPIIKNRWPEWNATPDGGFERMWVFLFEAPLEDIAGADLDGDGLSATVSRLGPNELRLIARTQQNPMADRIFFDAFFSLFRRLEERFGRLKEIQGQPRNLWRPFRYE
jgi:hypothetical protein